MADRSHAVIIMALQTAGSGHGPGASAGAAGPTYMTISLRVVSSIMYLVQSFQLS